MSIVITDRKTAWEKANPGKTYPSWASTVDVGLKCEDPSLCQQSMAPETDVNVLISRWKKQGIFEDKIQEIAQNGGGVYGDFSAPRFKDLTAAHQVVTEAREKFLQMPPELREKFENDPAKLVSYLNDPKNLAQSYELGLRVKPVEQMGTGVKPGEKDPSGNVVTPPPK